MARPRPISVSVSRRLTIAIVSGLSLLALSFPTSVQRAATAPILLTKINSTRAIAVESTNLVAEPFTATAPVPFAVDNRTRIILFSSNLSLANGETVSAVTADAEDGNHQHYPLTVEYVGTVSGFPWMTAVTVRLNDNLGDVGDVLIGISYAGLTSNRVRVGIGHIGGGPPDDTPPPQPVPDLGLGAS
ncbi:MAG TPA: hypothetical protein VFH91_09715, partial [Pyrinomonadaceae bacterium]|nr:hypothetical protein [Pyrinomonadaceae bacterium]